MLLRHHGASLSTIFSSRIVRTTSRSYSDAFIVARDTMSSLVASLNMPSAQKLAHSSRAKVWQPSQGIVFGRTSSSLGPTSVQSMSTSATSHSIHEIVVEPEATNSDLLAISRDFAASNTKLCTSTPQVRVDPDVVYRAPKNASAEAVAEVECDQGQSAAQSMPEPRNEDDEKSSKQMDFQIPTDVLQKAKDAAPGTKESYWSYKMYLGPQDQEVKVHYCKSKHTSERVAQYFVDETVIGFDIEWKPDSTRNSGIKNNVSLIQLASETRIALFHVALFSKDTASDLVAPTFKKIMEDPQVTKVGVAIKADCTRLRNFLEIDSKGIFELSHLYKLVRYSSSGDLSRINKKLVSLSTQAEEHFKLPIYKGEVRGSDWTQPLSMEQIIYAASDAYANFMLFNALESKRKQLQPAPPRPHNADLNLPIRLVSGSLISASEEIAEDQDCSVLPLKLSSTPPASVLEAARQNIRIEDDLETNISSTRVRQAHKFRLKDPKNLESHPKPQHLIDAEGWVEAHRTAVARQPPSEKTSSTVSFSVLRAYALWYNNPSLSISDIASVLREPPLQNSTVIAYVLDAIRIEKLPFDKERTKSLLQTIPDSRNWWRYRGLWRLIE